MGRTSVSRIPVVELVITEELDLWALSRLTRLLDDALAVSPVEIVIDLAQCPYLDAAAIGVLLEAHRRARLDGGLLTLRSPSERLRRNLRLARADRVLHVIPPEVPAELPADMPAELPAGIPADREV
ncbi:STAS domain-containing protein [Hamadaea sp. NPDC050747]|uniref:STAS domain-containing protein n=1 Tax=Hamadaea sp. NPDC050747 TaxID=3155789 RepID=UPI003409EF96